MTRYVHPYQKEANGRKALGCLNTKDGNFQIVAQSMLEKVESETAEGDSVEVQSMSSECIPGIFGNILIKLTKLF